MAGDGEQPAWSVLWGRLRDRAKACWLRLRPFRMRNEEDSEELPIEDGEEALDLGLGAEAGLLYNGCPPVTIVSPSQPCLSPTAFGAVSEVRLGRQKEISPGLVRESSVQSDVTSHGSHGSSVDSFLESRKPDPEEVLLNLGFGGPPIAENEVSRIPRRFLQPSKVKGVAIDDFLRYQQDLIENFETGFCGYRGLTGSPVPGASSTHIVSSASSPVRTFAPLSPIFSENLVNIPPRFVPLRHQVPRKHLCVPGGMGAGGSHPSLGRSLSSRRQHLSAPRSNHDRRASEPHPTKV